MKQLFIILLLLAHVATEAAQAEHNVSFVSSFLDASLPTIMLSKTRKCHVLTPPIAKLLEHVCSVCHNMHMHMLPELYTHCM